MKIKTATLTDLALNWAVATARGFIVYHNEMLNSSVKPGFWVSGYYPGELNSWVPLNKIAASTDWAQAGPILDREGITVRCDQRRKVGWEAFHYTPSNHALTEADTQEFMAFGPTPLVAAMRCFVLSMAGDEIEVPDELC